MNFESFLVSLYVLVDDWWRERRLPMPGGPGRSASLSEGEVLTFTILAQVFAIEE
jgi:hypothetical protein